MDENRPHRSVKDLIENLLFLASEPLTLSHLADSLPHSREEIAAALDALQAEYLDRGLKLKYVAGGYQFMTDPVLADQVESFFNLNRRKRLSRQALETLAVVAYNQPVTRAEIESIRGVQTSGTLLTLLEYDIIKVVGQKDTVGNPYLYGTTDTFLEYFGLGSISELPQLEFEREGLTRPVPVKSGNGEVPEATEGEPSIKPVDFGLTDETAEVIAHVKQKGA